MTITIPWFLLKASSRESPDIHIPLTFEPALRPGDSNMHEPWNWWLFVMGRLRSDATAQGVATELRGVFHGTALEGWNSMPADMRSRPEFQGDRAVPQVEVRPGSRGLAGNRRTYAARVRALAGMVLVLVKDARYTGQRDDVPQTLYIPYIQTGPTQMNFALRTAVNPAALLPSVRAAIREVDPGLPIFEVRTQVDVADQRLSPERRLAWLSSGSGLLALLLTCLALYGTLSYNVSRHTPEIGIRMALGAQRPQVIGSVLRESLTLVAVGSVLGLLAAQASVWLVADQLFGITAGAAGVRLAAAMVLLAVATLAASIPARRASRVDPMVALGTEQQGANSLRCTAGRAVDDDVFRKAAVRVADT